MITQYKNIFINLQSIGESDFSEFAETVKERYNLYLVSNQDIAADLPFTAKFIGAEMGCRLPSLEIFDKALEAIGGKPSECMFIDSDIKNIHSAEEVGMSPILFYSGNGYYDMTVHSFKELINLI